MCGVEFCSMRIDQDARNADGEMQEIADETDLDASPAAEVNLPPTGSHDTSDVPDLPDGVEPVHGDGHDGEEATGDD
jgi:phosphomethylpyrimidine synthase